MGMPVRTQPLSVPADPHAAYRAISGRDPRFDGRLFVGVTSTGIYCRPSCPARTPRPENCRFYSAAAAAVAAGFRACRRCRPDSLPGSRDWDARGDLAARALRAIADGAIDRSGVAGLAGSLHVSARHVHRVLIAEVGASPLQLARTRRAQLARMLIDQTSLSMIDVAFAAGFASLRQFNDVMRAEFGTAPSRLRQGTAPSTLRRGTAQVLQDEPSSSGGTGGRASSALERVPVEGAALTLRLRYVEPYDAESWLAHVADRAIPGLERVRDRTVTRLLAAPGGPVRVTIEFASQKIVARLALGDLADLAGVVVGLRRWLDLDADPHLITAALGSDPLLGPLVAHRPGLRVPGTTDPFELAVRAVLGQQVSVAGARTLAGRLVRAHGTPGPDGLVVFPAADVLAAAGPERLRAIGLTGARALTLARLASAVADGLPLEVGADRAAVRAELVALPGIGPWTADYIALRALGDPDVFPAGDLVLRKALAELPGGTGHPVTVAAAVARAAAWSPWRGYAAQHLWTQWSTRTQPPTGARSPKSASGTRPGRGRMDSVNPQHQ